MNTPIFIFDIGKVLIDFDLTRLQQRIADVSTATLADLQRHWSDNLVAVESGRIDPQTFYAEFSASIGLSWSYDAWTHAWAEIYTIHPVGHALFLRLHRAGRRVAILSNLAEYNVTAIEQRFPDFFSVTQDTFFSFELGLHKPDPRIYEATCRALRLEPSQCVFLDDDAENVEGAQSVGMQAYQFGPANYASIGDTIQSLCQ